METEKSQPQGSTDDAGNSVFGNSVKPRFRHYPFILGLGFLGLHRRPLVSGVICLPLGWDFLVCIGDHPFPVSSVYRWLGISRSAFRTDDRFSFVFVGLSLLRVISDFISNFSATRVLTIRGWAKKNGVLHLEPQKFKVQGSRFIKTS